MATFAPIINETSPPSGIGYSRGVGTDRRFETLFDGISTVAVGGVKAADEIIQQDIYKAAEKEVNGVRNLFGVESATPGVPTALPPDLTKGSDYLRRLTEGYKTGTVKDSHYYGLLNTTVKSLRSRYPGYEKEIDNIIQTITGITPANALITALRREAESEATSASNEANFRRQYIKENEEYITQAYPDYFEIPEASRPTFEQLRSSVSRIKANEASVSAELEMLNLEDKRGTLSADKVLSTGRTIANNIVNQVLTGALNTAPFGGGDYNAFVKKIDALQKSGKSLSPKEQEEITMQFRELELSLSEKVNQAIYAMPGFEKLSESQRKDILGVAKTRLDGLREAILTSDYALIKANAAWIKASDDANQRRILESPEYGQTIANMAALKEKVGPEVLGLIFSSPGGAAMLDDFTTSIVNAVKSKAIVDPTTDVTGELGKLPEGSKVSGPAAIVKSITDDLANPAVPAVVKAPELAFMFTNKGGLSLKLFPENQRTKVFNRVVSPAVTAEVLKLKNSLPNGKELWTNYTAWVYNNFQTLFRSQAATAENIPDPIKKLINVEWNKETGQFEVSSPKGINPEDYGVPVEWLRNAQDIVGQRYREMNTLINTLKPIVEEDGLDSGEAIGFLLESMGMSVPPKESPGGPDERTPKTNVLESGLTDATTDLLNTIGFGEAPGGYNQRFGERAGSPAYALTTMTIDQVLALPANRAGGYTSSASGKYQIVKKTLEELKDKLGLKGNELFDEEMQDRLAKALLERRGLNDLKAGKMSPAQFANNLAKEWASLPTSSGRSFYKQPVAHSPQTIIDLATSLAEDYWKEIGIRPVFD